MSDSPREIAVNQGALAFQRREALTQLIKEAPADLFEILEIAVQSEAPYFRRDVVKIAASAPEEVACRFLQKALCDENDYVRQDATHTLVERFGEECRDELEKLLGDRSYSVRSAAEAALRKFGKQPTAEAIPAPPPTEPDPVVEHAQERPPRSDSETVDKPKEDPHPASAPPSLKNPTHTIAPSGVSISLLERFFQGTLSDHLADCSELEKLLGQLRIQNHQDQKNQTTRIRELSQWTTAKAKAENLLAGLVVKIKELERRQAEQNRRNREIEDDLSNPGARLMGLLPKFREEQEAVRAMARTASEVLESELQPLLQRREELEKEIKESLAQIERHGEPTSAPGSGLQSLQRRIGRLKNQIRHRVRVNALKLLLDDGSTILASLLQTSPHLPFLKEFFHQWKILEGEVDDLKRRRRESQVRARHLGKKAASALSDNCEAVARGFCSTLVSKATTVSVNGEIHIISGNERTWEQRYKTASGTGKVTASYSLEAIDWEAPERIEENSRKLVRAWRHLGRAISERRITQARLIALREYRREAVALLLREIQAHQEP